MNTYLLYLKNNKIEKVQGSDIVDAIKKAGHHPIENNIVTFSVGTKKEYKYKNGEWIKKKKNFKSFWLNGLSFKQKINFYIWHYKTIFNSKNIYYRFGNWYHVKFEEHELEPIPEYGDIYTIQEFKENCDCGGFINSDGFAHPIINNMMDGDIIISPSQIKKGKFIKKYKSVVWFNK